jgi:Mg2+ and Co2+ transporter CorA
MAEFGIERFSEEAQGRITVALTGAGLSIDPPLGELDRRDTVILSRQGTGGDGGAPTHRRPLAEAMAIRVAEPRGCLERAGPGFRQTDGDGSVMWIDLPDAAAVDEQELFEYISGNVDGRVTRELVADVLSPDPRPRIKRHNETGIRCVAAFQAFACESDEGAAEGSSSKAGVLVFEPVEFLVAGSWLVTCWHDCEVYRGAERIREGTPAPPPDLFSEVERCWPEPNLQSAGDLALLVLRELALTYAPAYRQFYVWQDEWELDFYRRPDRIDRETLLEVRAAAAVFRDWLTPLNPPGMRQDVDRAWFPGITGTPREGGHEIALRVDDRIDGALKNLRDFTNTLRSAYDLLQLREGERERERDDRFQRNIAVGGSAILIPTLVAGIMGANTWVPGQWKEHGGPPHWAFLALVGLVLLSGLLAWVAIHWLQQRDHATH